MASQLQQPTSSSTSTSTSSSSSSSSSSSWPLYDLFMDVPHSAASPTAHPHIVIAPPDHRSDIVVKELGNEASIGKIARFAFPDYDDQAPKLPCPPTESGAGLNRHDQYCTHHRGFQHYTFSLQLSNGTRVHGHVRLYLPSHREATSRFDVGRRGVRALLLLTRAPGGDGLFAAILKTIEATTSQQAATPKHTHPSTEPQTAFLHALSRNHIAISNVYAQKAHHDETKAAPMVVSLQGAEFGNALPFLDVDTSRFLMPISILQPANLSNTDISSAATVSPLLPLLRVLGVTNSLRLLSALLSERRVLLLSSSPTRLSFCARSAVSMLAQGLMHWQHLYIPVLPPHLVQYLAAPVPYLMGMLSHLAPRIELIPELGELLIINLDTKDMQIRNMHPSSILTKIPDLTSGTSHSNSNSTNHHHQGSNLSYQATATTASPAEVLTQQLTELLKVDKKTISGESDLSMRAMETAKKTKDAVGKVWGKMKGIGKQYIKGGGGGGHYDTEHVGSIEEEEYLQEQQRAASAGVTNASASGGNDPSSDDCIYTEASQNEAGEEEARSAFTTFFLCLVGDMKWYLLPQTGQLPTLDRNRFIQTKRSMGDGEGTALFPLLTNLANSQMFEQFASARVEEIRTRRPIGKDAPLFLICANHHRQTGIEFYPLDIQRVVRQMTQANPSRFLVQSNATARRLAMALTSNKGFEGDYQQALAQLAEMCREASAVLFDVMSVVWMRITDSKGMQWKHGIHALYILKNLLLHGPLAAIVEITDGLNKIKALTKYSDSMRNKSSQQIRDSATQVYNLIVDRAKLFSIRRVCADRRRDIKHPPQGQLKKETRLRVSVPFCKVHAALAPSAHKPSTPTAQQHLHRMQQPPQQHYAASAPHRPASTGSADPVIDLLGLSGSPIANSVADTEQKANDILGMMNNMAVSSNHHRTAPELQQQYQQPGQAQGQNPVPTFAQPPPRAMAAAPPFHHNAQPAFAQAQGTQAAGQQRPLAQGVVQQHGAPGVPAPYPYAAAGQPGPTLTPHQPLNANIQLQQQPPPGQQRQPPPMEHPSTSLVQSVPHYHHQAPSRQSAYSPNTIAGAHPQVSGQQPPPQPNLFNSASISGQQPYQKSPHNSLSQFDPMAR